MSHTFHARIPGDSCNAVSAEIARMVLVMLGYRIRRTTDHLEVWSRTCKDERPIVREKEVRDLPPPRVRLLVDEGAYYSHTWCDWDAVVGTNFLWQETVDPCAFLELVCAALVPDYRPSRCGWIPDRGSDQVHIWWEAVERIGKADLPSWLSVGVRSPDRWGNIASL